MCSSVYWNVQVLKQPKTTTVAAAVIITTTTTTTTTTISKSYSDSTNPRRQISSPKDQTEQMKISSNNKR